MPGRATSLFVLILAFPAILPAQNIVPNGKFDSVNICSEHHYACCPKGWFYCSLSSHQTYGTLTCGPGNLCHCLAMLAADRDKSFRDYWQTHLLCPLQSGSQYLIRLKISASYVGPNLHDIGFYFTDRFAFTPFDTLIQPDHYIGFLDAAVQDLGFGWFQLEKKITATGNESILIIGNFSPESNKQLLKKRGKKAVDILVTDIAIQPIDGTLCPGHQDIQTALFAIRERHSITQLKTIGDLLNPNDQIAQSNIEPPRAPIDIPKIDTLRIPDIDFEFNSYHLTDSNILEPNRPLLEKKDINHILVAGYTDDKGTETYNLNLSQQRAQEAARLLTQKFSIPDTLITAEGRGISHTYKNDAANRRVEIYIYH